MVVVSSALIPIMSGLHFSAAAMNFSTLWSTPMSCNSNPAPSAIMPTRFFPISCKSPRTVPISKTPFGLEVLSFDVSSGFSTAMPAFIARATINTSGTYRTLCLKSSPTTLIPAINPSFNTSCAERPSASAALVNRSTSLAFPSYSNWFISA